MHAQPSICTRTHIQAAFWLIFFLLFSILPLFDPAGCGSLCCPSPLNASTSTTPTVSYKSPDGLTTLAQWQVLSSIRLGGGTKAWAARVARVGKFSQHPAESPILNFINWHSPPHNAAYSLWSQKRRPFADPFSASSIVLAMLAVCVPGRLQAAWSEVTKVFESYKQVVGSSNPDRGLEKPIESVTYNFSPLLSVVLKATLGQQGLW